MERQSRRRFLATSSLACSAVLLRAPRTLAAEGPPETEPCASGNSAQEFILAQQ